MTDAAPAWLADELRALGTPLITLRRHVHRLPELGWTEYGTAAFIAEKLHTWGWTLTLGEDALCRDARMGLPDAATLRQAAARAAGEGAAQRWLDIFADGMTAIRAELHLGPASATAPVLVVRVDMDALNVRECREDSHLPAREGFLSAHAGIMHACGHDGHMSIALGLARLLARHAARFPQPLTVRLLFQPAEEGVRGAAAMLKAGALDGADFLLGLHIGLNATRTGQLVCGADEFLATTKLNAFFEGRAAHAANAPQEGRNALLAASSAALGLHAISRHGDGPTRVCAGVLHAGSSRNSIPEYAALELEVRAASREVHHWVEDEARRVLAAAAQLWQCEHRVLTVGTAPAASSDARLRQRVVKCAAHLPFFQEILPACGLGASEDFSVLLEEMRTRGAQGAYLLLGSTLAGGHHTPRFDFDERILLPAVDLLTRLCLDIAAAPEA